jgi:predicted flap endonuclease-1-like 5' DNA nuclease
LSKIAQRKNLLDYTKDIEAVNKAIKFFPDRIEKDDWVGQARDLANRKH